ncbi:acyl-CoA dehydrogenase family protein [Mycolicibacterium sp. P9-22]|uniref:acyl-CoA dehydrogenase family protein n=1 Tax=Mycolicibacterium sp. P9-22 TaxID=2024613 RepID=UPI0011ED3327|nr:acyl-CoA dehydrogenase family protein [Mycolicibacterium sp. P9-22]KAA0120609.1 acyl-CoA dehydrogenase [Mycolicibacterium sp. P9-22]
MNFELDSEQEAFRDGVRKFFEQHSAPADVRRFVDGGEPRDEQLWRTMATELGLHGIALDDEHGGAGAGLVELALVLEEAGRALLCSPLLATVLLAATAIQDSGDVRAAAHWLPLIADGDLVATLAVTEDGDPFDLDTVATVATPTPAGWALTGRKRFVVDGDRADVVIVAANTPRGLSILAVDTSSENVTIQPEPVLDLTRPLSTVTMNEAPGSLLGVEGNARPGVERTLRRAAIGLAAEQVGVAQACLDMAIDYAKTRHQFGRAIGSFQAIKHQCADILVDVEASRTLTYFAAWSMASGTGDDALLAEMAAAYASDAAYRAAARNLQIHGGIGYTWEHDAHLLFKRATASAHILRSPSARRLAIADGMGL